MQQVRSNYSYWKQREIAAATAESPVNSGQQSPTNS